MLFRSDQLFPMIAMDGYLGMGVSILFILGLVAAAYSSADSALTALTTSVCVDFLEVEKRDEASQKRIRKMIHIAMSVLLVIVIVVFKSINDDSVISELFKAAGYTYGPLLGLFAFGLFNKLNIQDKWVPIVCILAPIATYVINLNSINWFGGYKFGFELLILNGVLTFIGLYTLRKSH